MPCVLSLAPGWLYPLMNVLSAVSGGRAAAGWKTQITGVPLQLGSLAGMLNAIVSPLPSAFASVIAPRREQLEPGQEPLFAVVLTVIVVAAWAVRARSTPPIRPANTSTAATVSGASIR